MKILQGRQAKNLKEAAYLAYQEAGANDMSDGVAELFASITDANTLRSEAEKSIATTIRDRYKKKPEWESNWWCVPIPTLRYESRDVPHLAIETKVYLVAAVNIETTDDSYSITLVGAIGKPVTLVIPILFLQAILNDDLERFGILARSGSYTTWDIPGSKSVQLPNDFTNKLSEIFKRKSVGMWLGDFGSQGRSVAPLVVGNLLGLQFQDRAQPVSVGEEAWTTEQLISALEGMAYAPPEAEDMVRQAASNLRADHTLEEALRLVLQRAGRGE
jgi:hypothetical protein